MVLASCGVSSFKLNCDFRELSECTCRLVESSAVQVADHVYDRPIYNVYAVKSEQLSGTLIILLKCIFNHGLQQRGQRVKCGF